MYWLGIEVIPIITRCKYDYDHFVLEKSEQSRRR